MWNVIAKRKDSAITTVICLWILVYGYGYIGYIGILLSLRKLPWTIAIQRYTPTTVKTGQYSTVGLKFYSGMLAALLSNVGRRSINAKML